MYIQLKENVNIKEKNEILKEIGIQTYFVTEEKNQRWLDDINNNPNSYQKHLKPKDRNLTMVELKEMFVNWCTKGLLEADLSFERTSEEDMVKLASFIVTNKNDILYVRNISDLVERGNIENSFHETLISLEEKGIELPEEEKDYVKLQQDGGLLLCKSHTKEEKIWLLFGHCDTPMMMKDKIYTNDEFNPLYKDSEGHSYMLIPLMPMSGNVVTDGNFGSRVFSQAIDEGMKEDIHFFLPFIYKFAISDIKNASESFRKSYTVEERIERIGFVLKSLNTEFMLNYYKPSLILKRGGLLGLDKSYHGKKCEDKPYYKQRLNFLNALILSLRDDFGRIGMYYFEDQKHNLFFYKGKSQKSKKYTF